MTYMQPAAAIETSTRVLDKSLHYSLLAHHPEIKPSLATGEYASLFQDWRTKHTPAVTSGYFKAWPEASISTKKMGGFMEKF